MVPTGEPGPGYLDMVELEEDIIVGVSEDVVADGGTTGNVRELYSS